MRKLMLGWILALVLDDHIFAQSLYERFPNKPEEAAVVLIAYNGNLVQQEVGSGTIYLVPTTTNIINGIRIYCLVTAYHMLRDPKTLIPYDGLVAKINMPIGSSPRYVKIPLKNDPPRNYWTSPSGYDLAVVPLPARLFDGAAIMTFSEDEIVTPSTATNLDISAGLLVEMFCIQFEYLDKSDYLTPQNSPVLRVGHLSRLGFSTSTDGTTFIRPHVIDIHSSFGNSGAPVLVEVPAKDLSVCRPFFLGVVKGFNDEMGAYVPYDAPLTNEEAALTLVGKKTGTTNQVAITIRTVANPNLTYVTPVHELFGLRDSPDFQAVLNQAALNQESYEILDLRKLIK
jgi:hypothetical protein